MVKTNLGASQEQLLEWGLIDESNNQMGTAEELVVPGPSRSSNENIEIGYHSVEPEDAFCGSQQIGDLLVDSEDDDEEQVHLQVEQGSVEANKEASTKVLGPKKHHKGKISTKRMTNRKSRMKSFFQRKKTLLLKADQIHSITGAQVKLKIVNSDTGKTITYDSNNTMLRNAGVQCGQPTLPRRESTRTNKEEIANTPKKVRSRQSIQKLVIKKLPGRKSPPPPIKPHNKVNGVCKVCSVIYESAKNKAHRKGRKRATTWIGCEKAGCNYWAHANCANVTFKPGKKVEEHKFLCPNHRT